MQTSAMRAVRLGGQERPSLKSGKMNTTVRVAKSNMTFGVAGGFAMGQRCRAGGVDGCAES
jgi:hypothetical protein